MSIPSVVISSQDRVDCGLANANDRSAIASVLMTKIKWRPFAFQLFCVIPFNVEI